MLKFKIALVAAAIVSCACSRTKVVTSEDRNGIVGSTSSSDKGLNDFLDSKSSSVPEDAKLILGTSLLGGVRDASLMDSSVWDEDSLTLTVELKTETEKLFGEVATASKMPVFWSLDKHLEFQFVQNDDEVTVGIKGVHTEPSKQGLELYEALMEESGLDPEGDSALDMRIEASLKYLTKPKSRMSMTYVNFEKFNVNGKIRMILGSTFGKMVMRNAVAKTKGWGSVFLSMCAVPPITMTSMVFTNGKVYSQAEAYTDKDVDIRYTKYGFKAMSDLLTATQILGAGVLEESAARSAINFAKMVGYGIEETREQMDSKGITAGDPKAIANLMSWCATSEPRQDPTCKDKEPGRVSWSPQKPFSMDEPAF